MALLENLSDYFKKHGLKIAVAESCTGGALSAKLTSISGSSSYFVAGFITYNNQTKIDLLDVSHSTLKQYGAVSQPVVQQMTKGVITKTTADIAISISGIAGPTGGSQNKPVGTVWFGFNVLGKKQQIKKQFYGSRAMIIKQSVDFALSQTFVLLQQNSSTHSL